LTPNPTNASLQSSEPVGPANPYHGRNYRGRDSLAIIELSNKILNEILSKDGVTIEELLKKDLTKFQSFQTKNSISLRLKIKEVDVQAPNVIGIIEGTDTSAGHIVVVAHHDHDGRQPNGGIRYGAVDNASGTVALMEIAKLINKAATKGLQPKRTIIFLSTTAEEVGLLGSFYYVDNPVLPLKKTWAVMNLDMLGARDTLYDKKPHIEYIYASYIDSAKHGVEKALYDANTIVKLSIDSFYLQPQQIIRDNTSDHTPFHQKKIPFIYFRSGITKDYHEVTDTPDKVDFNLLKKHTQLAFLTLWNLAND
jgi:Zn-dependent M28 family amino/carboxypeptidase